jgi:hypothetical protein
MIKIIKDDNVHHRDSEHAKRTLSQKQKLWEEVRKICTIWLK